MRVKIFSSNNSDSLERDINHFLEEKSIQQPSVRQCVENTRIEYQTFVHPSGIVNYSAMLVYM